MPHAGQTSLLAFCTAVFAAGGLCATVRLWTGNERLRPWIRAAEWLGLVSLGAVLAWHILQRGLSGGWEPVGDNYEALLWLAFLLAGFVAYVQLRRPIAGLEPIMMPVVVGLLIAAAGLEAWLPREYDLRGVWVAVHRVTSYAGAACFAVAAVAGVLYLRLSSRLRHKRAPGPGRGVFGNLERLEGWTFTAVTLGFALLTISLVTGLSRLEQASGAAWRWSPKIALAVAVWIIYALVLHAPILPNLGRFRGRKTAWLSIAGFILMLGTLVAVQWMLGSVAVSRAQPSGEVVR